MLPFEFLNWIIYPDELEGQFKYFAGDIELSTQQNFNNSFGYIKYPVRWNLDPNFKFFSIESKGKIFRKEMELNSIKSQIGPIIFPDKNIYSNQLKKIKEHIQVGDIYEMNFCFLIKAEVREFSALDVFLKLYSLSKAPHSCLAKFGDVYVICASPERFLKRVGKKIITQPIKGTARRYKDILLDEQSKKRLMSSEKEKSEHVMAVDVARNDLSRIALRGSVEVQELFGLYSYKQVHQMVSTVRCIQKDDVGFNEIVSSTFPMASMTGAPKIRAMQLIDTYEDFARGFYSGSMGVINQNGDFDFNVVIRSIIYDSSVGEINIAVGSAITILSDPEEEWNECKLKAEAMLNVL